MKKNGKLIVHTGSMFSGKTSSLWKELFRMKVANYKVVAFKPKIDNRYDDTNIVTHDQKKIPAIAISDINEIKEYLNKNEVDVIGIDEIQFFRNKPEEIVDFFQKLIKKNIKIIVSGLDIDYKAKPFEIMKELMPIADVLEKHHAICANCGEDAWISFRKTDSTKRVEIGSEDKYEPLCRGCYEEKMNEKEKMKNQISIDFI
ncbi:MAG: thymidine kinase [Peptoniphilaceae bacterium]|nr:thymidine kinase [Peptoniphilaceae bacterium]MDD7383115.1 thymidine kinase [Peptoniphilaceae bacterium]MDY3738361.1 thymidine kinase [Peptoniphilaceae bacterium]